MLYFKSVARSKPGTISKDELKYYAIPVTSGKLDIASLSEAITQRCTVNGADVRAVVYALCDVIREGLADGKIVSIDGLGSMRVGISSKGEEDAEKVTANSVLKKRIIFKPSPRLTTGIDQIPVSRLPK